MHFIGWLLINEVNPDNIRQKRRSQMKTKHDGQASAVLLLKISQTWLMDEDYSSFLVFLAAAFLAGFSSAGSSAGASALAALAPSVLRERRDHRGWSSLPSAGRERVLQP